jgi:hypothetical protein
LQDYLDAIGVLVPEGAPAFVRGFIPLVPFLTGHPNPTELDVFKNNNTTEQADRWMRTVENKKVEWGFGHQVPIDERDPASRFIQDNFQIEWQNDRYVLWKRRAEKTMNP